MILVRKKTEMLMVLAKDNSHFLKFLVIKLTKEYKTY